MQSLAHFSSQSLEVQIYAQSPESYKGVGTSTISGAHNSSTCNGQVFEGNFMLFKQSSPGTYRVSFHSQGASGSASQSLDILVSPEQIFNLK
ncbi:hypothetical protein NHP21005_16570 [Helicobacter sp. NHP21005]|uniref:hypothetical protein n=1 Tax=Helicobacter felistomachi TaxID=3040201 RepID=UPI002572AFC4|nr:hypothetical protein [Helicobacter sp. NHP21005]BEG57969.1 hypothetical protein NHP21005_16570 [Helicobacter sp. NHP21005]